MDFNINYLAVILAVVSTMIVGSIWYAPFAFGKTWMKLVGKTDKDIKGAGMAMSMMVVVALIEAVVLSYFINLMNAHTLLDGLKAGALIWVGFVATALGVHNIFEGRNIRLWLINAGYHLVNLVIMGMILAVVF